jgi:hypothetical protein
MEMSGLLYALAALTFPGKEPLHPLIRRMGGCQTVLDKMIFNFEFKFYNKY